MFIIDDEAIANPLESLHGAAYQIGTCQIIPYDPARSDLFPQPFLYSIYEKLRTSGRSKMGSLPNLFCGMTNLGPDNICPYLLNQRVAIAGEWRASRAVIDPDDPLPDNFDELCQPYFHPLGLCFPSVFVRNSDGLRNSAFAGYGFFQESWRSRQQFVLTYLGMAYLFREFHLVRLNGIRYHDNKLTARWMEQFGFRDVATIPDWMTKVDSDDLVPGTFSTLSRIDFEEQLRQIFRELQEAERGG